MRSCLVDAHWQAYAEAAHGVLDKIAQRMATMPHLTPAPPMPETSAGSIERDQPAARGPAAICPRRSSPTMSSHGGSITSDAWISRANGQLNAISCSPDAETTGPCGAPPWRGALERRRRRAGLTSISSSSRRRLRISVFPSTVHSAGEARARGGPAFDVQAVCADSSMRWRLPTRWSPAVSRATRSS